MGAWVKQIHGRAAILLEQMNSARRIATSHGGAGEDISRPYLEKIEALYEDELPWAQLMDESDLVVQLRGPAVDRPAPMLSAVSSAFDDIRSQVARVTKAIIGLSEDMTTRGGDLQLALSGIARGSLVVGVRVARPSEATGDAASLFGDDDPLYLSVREAVRQIAVVTQHVSEDGLDDSLRDAIPDPAVRDALTVAAQRLAPSGKRGILEVTLYSPESRHSARPLTPSVRRALSVALSRPMKAQPRRTVEGVVREIDLDARRFELRRLKAGEGAVRCIYSPDEDARAEGWLNRTLRVSGRVELGPNNEPRLLLVEDAKLARERKPKQGKLVLARRA